MTTISSSKIPETPVDVDYRPDRPQHADGCNHVEFTRKVTGVQATGVINLEARPSSVVVGCGVAAGNLERQLRSWLGTDAIFTVSPVPVWMDVDSWGIAIRATGETLDKINSGITWPPGQDWKHGAYLVRTFDTADEIKHEPDTSIPCFADLDGGVKG